MTPIYTMGEIVVFRINPAKKAIITTPKASNDRNDYYYIAYFDDNGVRREEAVADFEIMRPAIARNE